MNPGTVRRKIGKIVLLCIATIALSFAVYRAITVFLSIEIIEVTGNNVQVIVDEKKISRNLLFFPADRIRDEVLRDNPILSDVQFHKKYPHTLIIVPTLRPALVQLRTPDRLVLIDRDGVVLVDGDQGTNLPVFRFTIPVVRVGEKISDPSLQHALAVFASLQSLLLIESVTQQDGAYVLVKTAKTDIFIPQDKDPAEILATLQTLIAGFRIKGTLPAVVDLRFDKPVITF